MVVREVLDYYENQSEEEAVAEEEDEDEEEELAEEAAPGCQNLSRSDPMATMTAKQRVQRLLNRLPDDVSLEKIRYHVCVLHTIEQGLDDLEAGRVVGHEEVERQMRQWLDRQAGLKKPGDR